MKTCAIHSHNLFTGIREHSKTFILVTSRSEKRPFSNAVFMKCFRAFNEPSGVHVGQV